MVDTCISLSVNSTNDRDEGSEDPPAKRTEQVYDNLVSTIGNTPLIALHRCFPNVPFNLFAKLEAVNPGGSAKDRSAWGMLKHALDTGELHAGGTVIESSSGNMAIGIAQACCSLDLHFICVVDANTTMQHLKILRAYGAEIIVIANPDPVTGEFLHARLNRVKELMRDRPNAIWLNQYANEHNTHSHIQTMAEIVRALNGAVDCVLCPVSTCGTIGGCQEYIRQMRLDVTLVAVDAVGSVIFGGEVHRRLLPGHGSAIRPPLADYLHTKRIVYVTDEDCVAGCRRLVRTEGILAGASSGGAVAAITQIWSEIRPKGHCVVILPDRGERYLDTVYSDSWVRDHFGAIPDIADPSCGDSK